MDMYGNDKVPTSALTSAQMLVDLKIAEEGACIERLQAQIREHEERIRELKSKRNANAEIAKLYPEILQRIFHNVQESFMKDDSGIIGEDRSWSASRWHHVAHVCRYWRTLALNTATLWTTILNDRRHRWTELCLQRSGNAPLEVRLNWSQYRSVGRSILQHITRMRVLEIQFYAGKEVDFSVWDELQTLCHQARGVPLILERLHVQVTHASHAYTLSKKWFTRAARLQHLRLEGVDFSWDDIPFHTIRTLYVRPSDASSARITVDQLLASVKQLLIAEELSLFKVFSPAGNLPPVPRSKGCLPSLRKLSIRIASSPSLAWLLSCIELNKPLDLLNIYVVSAGEIPDSTGHAEFFLALSRIPQQKFSRLEIYHRYESCYPANTRLNYISLEMFSAEQLPGYQFYQPPFRVQIEINGMAAQAHKVATNFCAMADFSCLSHISVEKLPAESLTSMFGMLPRLTSIQTFYSTSFTGLVEALTIPMHQPPSDTLHFPTLAEITALKFNINDSVDNPQEAREHYTWDLLEVCLLQRRKYRAPIERIIFGRSLYDLSGPDALELQRLKEIVPNISFKDLLD